MAQKTNPQSAPECPNKCGSTSCVRQNLDACKAFASKPIVWVLGGPGSGKGTQCEKIIAKYGFTHLSTGDLLRAEVKSESDRAKTLTALMEQGELVPNDIVLELLKEAMLAAAPTANGFLIDGYPREESQGAEFEKTIVPVTTILYFEASPATLTKRLLGRAESSGRADDNEDTIKLRIHTFLENNEKVLAQYPQKLHRALEAYEAFHTKPIVWVLGGPGSGKGTQCEKIIEKYGYTHLSTGDLLRAEVKSGSDRAKALTAIMERGELVPNDIVEDLLKEAMIGKAATANGFLIDGYPREKAQGAAFEKAIAPVTSILYFEASPATLTKHLLGRAAASNRADDNEDTIKLRIHTFLDNNDKVLAQYPHKLHKINAERPPNEVFRDVEMALEKTVQKISKR